MARTTCRAGSVDDHRSPSQGLRRRPWLVGVIGLSLAHFLAGCGRQAPDQAATLALVDSILSELGGTPTANLERGQRWRMISSMGAGLPPSNFTADNLPEPGSRGAGLLQVYCVQCHWLPTPQMHSAAEWNVLVPRMLLRAEWLKYRMGGPLTEGLVGQVLMAGYTAADSPSEAQVDTILAYLQGNALPAAEPDELTPGPGRELFIRKCSVCHETPSPSAHTAPGWERVIALMQSIMSASNVPPLSTGELDVVSAYLRERALR
jgi:mono/diheme cytochrome c family protein